ncbi:hypothetical protein SDC9_81038 [bioreactor metagenome]|uniref:ABC-2 type transporter domain-containing protein n=1 Tax=bioreactor metagenome TaxID=1076179 RepID=A0A644Z0P2_9ZZZZ
MRKATIFKYEIKRLLLSREYLLLLAATLVYGALLLRSTVMFGTNFTAPFSPLTFRTYCASLAPFLFVLLLVLCARQLKASERGAQAIISATSLPLPVFRLLRYGAIGCAFLIAGTLPVTACFLFYRLVFDYTAVGALLGLGLLFLVPPAILLFGAAMFLSSETTAALYVLLAAVLILSLFQIPLPECIDIAGSAADSAPTPAFLAGRGAFTGLGMVFILASLFRPKKRRK